ncbi:laminin subunit alpha lam-3 isoform X1 [Danaus plexippus]|uniref:laminin subunit alpha lam-3 isoform X1 n=1 Tax=Danaus plexippus TaxID=13037 RepID=UPI002AB2516E|nr:laminin subunit alpha lam-3 isoform X1 [Danaus plexippus]
MFIKNRMLQVNVIGEKCDTCAPGHFGLSSSLPGGCRACYCSHVASHCESDPRPGPDIAFPLGNEWMISDNNSSETLEPSVDDKGKPYLISYEVEGWESYYFVTSYLTGQQLSLYGGTLLSQLAWGIARGDSGGSASRAPDFILVGNDGIKLTYGNTSYETPGLIELVAPLEEGGWYLNSEVASRSQLMDVMSNLKSVMIRAHFHFDQDEVRLERAHIRGSEGGVRELCTCAPQHAGTQCETCAAGHVRLERAPGTSPAFECVPCDCNMHADCDSVNGPCGPCQHNTTGPHCERCLPGHYGNPVQGACKPCACPLYELSNNFSPNCALAAAVGDDYVCTQCPDGYAGDHCEICDSGYWGSPATVGGSCLPCDCGGGPCHPQSGACLVCPPHTEGERCDQCQEGYWSGGDNGSCIACGCGLGALSTACDPRAGHCACAPGWTGRACNVCATGHGNVSAGCPLCACGAGSSSAMCGTEHGECPCMSGAAPPRCDTCLEQHYNLSTTGCLSCNCSSLGSESNVCDIRSGQCRCRPHVTGRACDTCEEGYWGLQHGGCRRCECGAGAAACDPVSGLCACSVGVGGARCDRCLSGYYGFGPTGCLPCPTCSEGRVCSPVSGRCVCPARTRGPGCSQCTPGYWGRTAGCHTCDCGPGAVGGNCDPVSGQCNCRPGWTGRACDRCARAHYGPRCRPCGCHRAGTRCEDGLCPCDSNGQCPCKDNVVGEKCDRCLEGTFGLSESNPVGCTACFCFGRSAQCTQAAVSRAALHNAVPLHLRLMRGHIITTMDRHSPLAIHTSVQDAHITLPDPPVPVYAELPSLFLGDRVLSYGGALRFRVEQEGGTPIPRDVLIDFPLVSIYGYNIVLDYYERAPPINNTYAVYLHESLWEVRGAGTGGTGAVASRGALMLTLRDVRRLLLRVSTREPTDEPLHVLLLNVTLETAIPGLSRGAPAPGVERCSCPRGYSSGSCQRPAAGFWSPPSPPLVTHVAGTIVIHVEPVRPCECNGRAVTCDPTNGHCLNCTANTSGPHCDHCAEGYYGTPDRGCEPCPCPAHGPVRATGCAASHGRLHCYCHLGYTGSRCESCSAGWRREGGACVPCSCDPRGALSQRCEGGRCHCRPYATGTRCQLCAQPGFYMDEEGCKPCDNCTQTLLLSMKDLTRDLHLRADLSELSRIPQPFPALREFANNASILEASLKQWRTNKEKSLLIKSALLKLESTEHELFTSSNKLKTRASRREKEAQYLSLESMSGLEEVFKKKRVLAEYVADLDDFARGEKHLSAHRALKEARHLLKMIKELNLVDFMTGANDVSDSANLQSTSVHEYKYRIDDSFQKIYKLHSSLEDWERKAEDLPRLAGIVWSAGDTVVEGSKKIKPKLARVRDIGLQCRLVLEDISNLSTNNLTEETRAALLHTQNLAVGFPTLLSTLRNLTTQAEEKEGILYNLTPKYKEKYLDVVKEHVENLTKKAREYKNLFAGTRSVASAGVQAARAWSEVAAGVRDAVAAADAATIAATTASKLARGPQPLIATADEEKMSSEILKRKGNELMSRTSDLHRELEVAQRGIDVVSVGLRGLGWRERALASGAEGGMMNGGTAAVATLKQASTQAERVFASSRVLYDEAADLRRKVRYQLRRNLAALQRMGDTALGAAEEHVSQIRGNTDRGREVAAALAAAGAARAREHAAAATILSPALKRLHSGILQAQHAAATISVSVTSPAGGVGCARAYSSWSAPSATRATLSLSFDSTLRDGTLLYLPDQDSERYLRLSVSAGKLVVRWDVGGGVGYLEHPEPLTPTVDDADHTVYRLQIERVWNTVRLRTERSGSAVTTSTNSTTSSPSTGLLRPQYWWLGEPDAPLPACVHSLHADHLALGLWAFAKQHTNSKCTGCTQRWTSQRGESLARLSGAGYVTLRRSRPADRRRFSLALSFRTTDHNALLFMAHDHVNNRSVSVWVRECRVVFKVQYANSRLEITAGGDHCDGKPTHVQATRVFNGLERGSLRVNGEETLGSPSPPVQAAGDLPELEGAYWVGGLPPDAQGLYEAPSLLGCIGGLVVDREGYDLLDTPTRYGLEPGCSARALRSAVLDGDGYIELSSPAIRRKTSIGVSFRTRSPSGLLMYRAPSISVQDNEVDDEEDDNHCLVLALVNGELEVIANAGKSELRLRINGTKYDDGGLYTVRLVRVHKQLEVWVDEKRMAAGNLPGGAIAARARGLYLGGSPSPVTYLTVPSFTGTIADFIVDSTWIGLESSVSHFRARLGRAQTAAPRPTPTAVNTRNELTNCAKLSSYAVEAGAVKFGDAVPSYAALRAARAALFSFSLQLRTFAKDGIVMLLPGSKQKPRHYVALLLREGRARLMVRGRRRKELVLPGNVSDGEWHELSVRISRSRLVLSSGSAAVTGRAPPHARAARLYLGGPPPAAAIPHVPNSLLKLGGLVGCVRRVAVGGRAEDPVRDARAHVAVSQCFPRVERGAYFGGDAYAEWSETGFAGLVGEEGEGDSVELRLEFRATSGVGLLAAFAGALLELKDGMVVLSRGGTSVESGGRVCDGRWHAAAARVWRAGLSLSLDGAPPERAAPALIAPAAPPTGNSLYVAGLPGARDMGDGRENFKGCVRDVTYRGSARSWRAASLHHVLLDSCPVSH